MSHKLPIVVHMCVFEQDYFLKETIESVIHYADKIIVIEGAWQTAVNSNGGIERSRDETIPILKKLQEKYPDKIEVHQLNEKTQLQQRSKHFEICPNAHWLWIVDSDEIYTPEDAQKVVNATQRNDFEYFDTKSLTFVNDYKHYVEINWPRLFRVDGAGYKFRSPNHLLKPNNAELKHCPDPIATFYHYSYIMTTDRMKKKIADRISTHGEFKWTLQDGWIKRKGVSFKQTNFKPSIVENHHMLQKEAPESAFIYEEPEKIGFLINSGMGNAILSTPALKAIRLLKPNARISVFNWKRTREVFNGLDFIDDNIMPQHYDRFIASIDGLDYLLCSPTAHLTPPSLFNNSKNVIKIKKGKEWEKHESEYNMDLVRKLGYNAPPPNPTFYTSKKSPDGKYAVVSVGYLKDGAQWRLKQIENNDEWIKPLKKLLDNNFKLLFLGTIDDHITSQKIISKLGSNNAISLCGATGIKYAAAIIKGAKLFIGLDGGLMHIAACYNVPSVIAWTFTNFTKNAPLNPNAEIIMLPCDKRNLCQHGNYNKCHHKNCRKIKSFHIEESMKKISRLVDIT